MAKTQAGMPGDGFFDIFRNCHRDEYLRITGDVQPNGLTNKQQLEMVSIERVTVYARAKTWPGGFFQGRSAGYQHLITSPASANTL